MKYKSGGRLPCQVLLSQNGYGLTGPGLSLWPVPPSHLAPSFPPLHTRSTHFPTSTYHFSFLPTHGPACHYGRSRLLTSLPLPFNLTPTSLPSLARLVIVAGPARSNYSFSFTPAPACPFHIYRLDLSLWQVPPKPTRFSILMPIRPPSTSHGPACHCGRSRLISPLTLPIYPHHFNLSFNQSLFLR